MTSSILIILRVGVQGGVSRMHCAITTQSFSNGRRVEGALRGSEQNILPRTSSDFAVGNPSIELQNDLYIQRCSQQQHAEAWTCSKHSPREGRGGAK